MPGNKVGNSMRLKGPTTNRVRRHEGEAPFLDGVYTPTAILPAPPPPPSKPPRSLGDFSTAPTEEIVNVTADHFSQSEAPKWKQRGSMCTFLAHLATFPGDTWQERWEASGHDKGRPVGDGAHNRPLRMKLNCAAGQAFALRLVRPTLLGFRCNRFSHYSPWFRGVAQDPLPGEFCRRADLLPMSQARRTRTKFDVCCALTVFGIDLKDLTPEALLHYAVESRRHELAGEKTSFAGTLADPARDGALPRVGTPQPARRRHPRAGLRRGSRRPPPAPQRRDERPAGRVHPPPLGEPGLLHPARTDRVK